MTHLFIYYLLKCVFVPNWTKLTSLFSPVLGFLVIFLGLGRGGTGGGWSGPFGGTSPALRSRVDRSSGLGPRAATDRSPDGFLKVGEVGLFGLKYCPHPWMQCQSYRRQHDR